MEAANGVLVNYLAILVCGVVSMGLGFLWYGPLFGKTWATLSGISMEKMKESKPAEMAKSYGVMFIGSLVMAYVLAHSLIFASTYLKSSGVSAGLMCGFWNWLGFVAFVTMSPVLWEKKPITLWFINGGYYLVQLLVFGVILATWV